jgi:hypothetical protein
MERVRANTTLDFSSKHCKQGQHQYCDISWFGFGFEFVCICRCHVNKEKEALRLVGRPVGNASTIKGANPYDYHSSIKRSDKPFPEKDLALDSVDDSIVDDSTILSSPLVNSLQESSNIHKIQEYEEKDMAEQLQNQDLD